MFLFLFTKCKQDQPVQFIKETELLRQMEDRKELSTSTKVRGEGKKKIKRRAQGEPTRQDTKDVSVPCHLKSLIRFLRRLRGRLS